MHEFRSCRRMLLALPLPLLFISALFTFADAQGLPESPAPGNPSNDCGCSRGDATIPVSSGMLSPFLPKIPNLELGFLYSFGNNVKAGRFTADYLLPFRLTSNSVLFGEAHAEGWGFWKKPSVSVTTPPGFTVTTDETSNRIDLSFGGGYRTMLGANSFFGVNGFYDTSRLFDTWYSSGGVGLEFAANLAGDDAIDLNFNWYGNLFNRDVLINAFRNKGNSFDVEAGYSHSLFNQALDLRLKLIGYQFDVGDKVYGWRGGADLTTRDGVFTLRYEYGSDRLNGNYNMVGGFANVGFQLENLLSGQSPFTLPEPVFKSPRDLARLLGLKVKRNWHQPAAVVLARSASALACPNLQGGSRFPGSSISFSVQINTDSLDPPVRDFPWSRLLYIKICWCKLINPSNKGAYSYLVNNGFGYVPEPYVLWPIFDTPTGCAEFGQQVYWVTSDPNWIVFRTANPETPLEFEPGGGLTISVRQP